MHKSDILRHLIFHPSNHKGSLARITDEGGQVTVVCKWTKTESPGADLRVGELAL